MRGAFSGMMIDATPPRANGEHGTESNGGSIRSSPRDSKNGDHTDRINGENGSPLSSVTPDDDVLIKNSRRDSAFAPDTGSVVPRLARKASLLQQPKRSSSLVPSRVLFDHVPDATAEATSQFQVITDCLYGSKNMGSSDHDAFDCDCAEEWQSGRNLSCGEDSDCINRATKMECVEGDCNCGEGCQNQRFQRKQYARVSVFKTEKKGYGLRTDAELHADEFIFEYIGEVINEPAFRRRMVQYDDEGIKHFYFMSLTKSEFVDATRKGNLGRFCNHSCNPNCYVDKWVVGNKLRMGIFASRSIEAGEELVFDYNVDRYGADPQPCYCGEPNCTGFIGGKTQTERASKLPQATIAALGIEDPDGWDTTIATKKPRRKRANEGEEEYINSMEDAGLPGLVEEDVTKVMAALMQCKEKWIVVKLLARIQAADHDERVLNRVVRMHGYQILRGILTTFSDDNNVILQVLGIMYRFPRLTKNKISDSNIETAIEALALSDDEAVIAESKRLLEAWAKLETAYRIPRKKVDPNAPPMAAMSLEDRRGGGNGNGNGRDPAPHNDSDDILTAGSRQRAPLSPLHGMLIPKGPRSNVPQRNTSLSRSQRRQQKANIHQGTSALPTGWFTANDPNGNVYYYNKSGTTTWTRPTQPADQTPRRKKNDLALQEIIDSLTRKTQRPSASQTPQRADGSTPAPEAEPERKDKWRALPVEKQQKIYENTLFPHIKSVTDRFRNRLPREEIKKFGKEISKKLVASDYKNNRVEDPHTITPRQEKKVKAYVKDFFERAAEKYHEHEKKKAERGAQHAAHSDGGPDAETVILPATSAATDALVSDVPVPVETHDAADVAMTDDDEGSAVHGVVDDSATALVLTPGHVDRKRKRVESGVLVERLAVATSGAAAGAVCAVSVAASPTLTPSEAPSLKRLKDDDASTDGNSLAPSTPPPPPPPPPLPPSEDEGMMVLGGELSNGEAMQRQEEEQRQREEDEAALQRENEEAMRDFEAQEQQRASSSMRKQEVVGH